MFYKYDYKGWDFNQIFWVWVWVRVCSEAATGLHKPLDGLIKFSSKWHLIASLIKTNVVIFGSKKPTQMFKFNDQIIDIVNEYEYFGTIFSSKTTDIFKINYGHLAKKTHLKMPFLH